MPAETAPASIDAHRDVLWNAAAGLDPSRVARWTRLRARAEAVDVDTSERRDDAARAWAGRLHHMADALG